jgi:hypothetical protein
MTWQEPPRRPPFARRYRIRFFILPVGLIVAFGIYLAHLLTGAQTVTGDFRDPAVLARAIESAAQKAGDGTADFSSCVQTVFPSYVCTVGFYGGSIATYNVTVATDGSWWHTT